MCFSFLKTLVFATRKTYFWPMAQNRGGRPRLPESEKKQHKVVVRLTWDQWKIFESTFLESGYKSQTDFILAKTASAQNALSPAELQAITELRLGISEVLEQQKRIGNNFNQLMHLAQAEKQLPQANELRMVATSFKALSDYAYKYISLIEILKEKWLSK